MALNKIHIFPASGFRNYSDGKLYYSGTCGYGWSSTPSNSSNAWNLNFHSGSAGMYNDTRGYGFPVRCVQASATVFVFTKDTFVFFPASGNRGDGDGKLYNSGASGFGWSSASYTGDYASRLFLNSGSACMGSAYRTFGFAVRCVQASAAVWAVRKKDTKQIRFRRESGKVRLYRRGRADSVTRLGCKLSAGENRFVCAAPSYSLLLIKLPVFNCLYFYKHFSGYFFFFPAAGHRNLSDGKLYNSGTSGYGWTSTPYNSSRAWNLSVHSGSAGMYNDTRGYGFPVRCVQASAAVFALTKDMFVFFPASGNRGDGDGKLYSSGASGYIWSSTPNGSSAYYLCFRSGDAYVVNNYRGYGLSVRCVQASAAVFAFTKDTFVFFPATGFRYVDAKLYNVNAEGHGWTSTPTGGNAWHYGGSAGNTALAVHSREFGFPVRCVQASAVVFAFTKDMFVFFPASGFRNYNSGSLGDSGKWGYSWTSTPNSGNAWYLDFYTGPVRVSNGSRGYGFAVRCVQASAPVFAFTKDMFVFFPASGFRSPDTGILGNSGLVGYCWVSTPAGGNYAYSLYAPSGTVRVANHVRNDGFSVRCVQASATVWIYLEEGLKQIRYRRESGKVRLCRRGQADSVTRLGCKLSANENHFVCAAPSYSISLIKLPVFICLYFYKHSSGYFLFFPAAGYRLRDDGTLRNSGTYGYGWTSTPESGGGSYLYFSAGGAYVSHYDRNSGRSVRCVQASASVFVYARKGIEKTPVFFPAAGLRGSSAGKLVELGVSGYGWSSTGSDNGNAYSLIFYSRNACSFLYSRSSGYSVRCVQASAAVFAFTKDMFCFFPATGYREFSDGRYSFSGSWGLVWASTPSSGNAWSFTISSGRPYMNANNRGYGFSVRCVQASAAVFVFSNYLQDRRKAA